MHVCILSTRPTNSKSRKQGTEQKKRAASYLFCSLTSALFKETVSLLEKVLQRENTYRQMSYALMGTNYIQLLFVTFNTKCFQVTTTFMVMIRWHSWLTSSAKVLCFHIPSKEILWLQKVMVAIKWAKHWLKKEVVRLQVWTSCMSSSTRGAAASVRNTHMNMWPEKNFTIAKTQMLHVGE